MGSGAGGSLLGSALGAAGAEIEALGVDGRGAAAVNVDESSGSLVEVSEEGADEQPASTNVARITITRILGALPPLDARRYRVVLAGDKVNAATNAVPAGNVARD